MNKQHVLLYCSLALGKGVIFRLDFKRWDFKKLLESECFCFPGLLMGVFCVGEKHHNSDTLLKYFNS